MAFPDHVLSPRSCQAENYQKEREVPVPRFYNRHGGEEEGAGGAKQYTEQAAFREPLIHGGFLRA